MNDMAAPRPSWKACIWFAMRGAIMTLVGPPTRSGTKNIPTRGTKVSAAAETTPGRSGQGDVPEGAERPRAEIPRRVEQRPVHLSSDE